jgi:hypothetical protein
MFRKTFNTGILLVNGLHSLVFPKKIIPWSTFTVPIKMDKNELQQMIELHTQQMREEIKKQILPIKTQMESIITEVKQMKETYIRIPDMKTKLGPINYLQKDHQDHFQELTDARVLISKECKKNKDFTSSDPKVLYDHNLGRYYATMSWKYKENEYNEKVISDDNCPGYSDDNALFKLWTKVKDQLILMQQLQ